jgi:O-antigen ligase
MTAVRTRHVPPEQGTRRDRRAVEVAVFALVPVLAVLTGVALVGGASKTEAALPIGIAAALAFVALAVTNFSAFVIAVLAVRATLDWSKSTSQTVTNAASTSSGKAATVVAILFLGAALTWLLAERRRGRPAPPSPIRTPLVLFLGACLLSVVSAADRVASLTEVGRLAATVVMFLVLERLFENRKTMIAILAACFVSTVVPILVAMYQAVSSHGTFVSGGVSRVRGTFVHPSPFAAYLAMMIVMAAALYRHLRPNLRLPAAAFLFVCGVLLLLTYSRTSWIAVLVGLLIVGWIESRRLIAGLIIAVMLAVVAVPSVGGRISDLQRGRHVSGTAGNSLVWRLDYWKEVLPLANKNPATGIGWAMTPRATKQAKPPHNDVIRAYVEAGLFGLAAYLALLFALVRSARQAVRRARRGIDRGIAAGFAGCVAVFLIVSVGDNLVSQVVLLWYFVAFAAAALAVSRTATREADHAPVAVGR